MASVFMIVARDRSDLYDRLRREFANDAAIAVFLDRRFGQRRRQSFRVTDDQRRTERRRRDLDDDLRRLGWATTRAS
jgi:hypothetical protein